MPPARALVVSLHDVSLRTHADCRRIISELKALGVPRTSLLVIPDHHHRGSIAADTGCCEWLRALEREGHEIVLHGYHHQRPRRAGETLRERLTTRFYTADEGEFYDLDLAHAREAVARGVAEFRALGFHATGFIAPAWLLSEPAEEALREFGLDYTTRLGSVTDLRERRTWRSQSLVWSVRSAWRRAVSRRWNALLYRRLSANPLLRVSIHPVDVSHTAIWKQIAGLITRALADRRPMTYHTWVTAQRAAQTPALHSPPA
jgi:predicted deacetylase